MTSDRKIIRIDRKCLMQQVNRYKFLKRTPKSKDQHFSQKLIVLRHKSINTKEKTSICMK